MALNKLDLLLGRLESGWGIEAGQGEDVAILAPGQTGPVVAPFTDNMSDDFRQVAEGFSVELKVDKTNIKQAVGALGQQRAVIGQIGADVKVTMYPVPMPNTETILDAICDFLRCSGMSLSIESGSSGYMLPFAYRPSSDYVNDWLTMTLNKYTGDKTSLGSYLTRVMGCMFNPTFKAELGKPFVCELTGMGAVPAMPDVATYPTTPITQLSDLIPPSLKFGSFNVYNTAYRLFSLELTLGNKIELVEDMSTAALGFLYAMIADRASTFKAKIVESPYASSGDISPFESLAEGDTFDFTSTFGYANGRMNLSTGYNNPNRAQLTGIKPGNKSGLNTWDIEGLVLDNDWQFLTNVQLADA